MSKSYKLRSYITSGNKYEELKQILNIIGDKWSALIIICVYDSPKRFTDIKKFAEGISPTTLTTKLNGLIEMDMIIKKEYKEFPPRTEYEITQKSRELIIAMKDLRQWAKKYSSNNKH